MFSTQRFRGPLASYAVLPATMRSNDLRRLLAASPRLPGIVGPRAPRVAPSAAPAGKARQQVLATAGIKSPLEEDTIPFIQYSAAENMDYWATRPVAVLKRTLQVTAAFSGWYVKGRIGHAEDPTQVEAQAERMRKILTELGPAFVKIGQAVSSRCFGGRGAMGWRV
jgi:hypothetical protein